MADRTGVPSNLITPVLVWRPADHRVLDPDSEPMPFLVLGEKYARAITVCAQVQPVVFPLADISQIPQLLSLVDGVMLTGSSSNVHPSHFGEPLADPSLPLDATRDALTLPLVTACVQAGIPLLGVCRGFQEINVAYGGTLQQAVHLGARQLDHREAKGASVEHAYATAHEVRIEPDSALARWAGGPTAMVNSLHGQGIGKLAPGLRAVAHAPDGLIEGIEVLGAKAFAYAVQWHPEWRCSENPFYSAILHAFGQACRDRHVSRLAMTQPTFMRAQQTHQPYKTRGIS